MENEQWKREKRDAMRQLAEERARLEAEQQARVEKQLSEDCLGNDCICSVGDEASAREKIMQKKVSLETEEAERENKVFKAKKVEKDSKQSSTLQKGEW